MEVPRDRVEHGVGLEWGRALSALGAAAYGGKGHGVTGEEVGSGGVGGRAGAEIIVVRCGRVVIVLDEVGSRRSVGAAAVRWSRWMGLVVTWGDEVRSSVGRCTRCG